MNEQINDPSIRFTYDDGYGDIVSLDRVFPDMGQMDVTSYLEAVLAFYAHAGFGTGLEIKTFYGDHVSSTLTYSRENYIEREDTFNEAVRAYEQDKEAEKESVEFPPHVFDEYWQESPIPLRKSLMSKSQVADYVATYGYDAWENLKG